MADPTETPRPESGTLAEPQVRAMFDRIAGVYDRLNSLMTAGLHHRWRDRAVELAQVGPGSHVLDVATGTGDMAFALAKAIGPGGHVVILEMTTPQRPPLSTFFKLWFNRIVPMLGRVAGDSDAYTYLPNSVRRFPGPDALAARMAAVGLGDIRYVLTAGGIIALHVGTVLA
jgi:ubiquinone/menaquinone biosynthesis C-methylase UbiE